MSTCIDWEGARNSQGYGNVFFKGKTWRAHRRAYYWWHGSIPDGAVIMHTCDNPTCVNPDHLVAGSYRDNALDMHRKGRHPHPNIEKLQHTGTAAAARKFAERTACRKGHPLTSETTYSRKNKNCRECRICIREREATRRKRIRNGYPCLSAGAGKGY